jgi:hypothetical protein
MKNSLPIFLICLFVSVMGCSFYKISLEETTLDFYPPKESPDEVVYLERVDKPHEIIGNVTVNTERIQTWDEILEKMKKEAAFLGGNGITNLRTNSGIWRKLKPQKLLGNANIRTTYIVDVIVFKK